MIEICFWLKKEINMHDATFSSPIVITRTRSMFEVMKTVCISHDNFSYCNLRDELGGSVAVSTYSKVFNNSDSCSRRCVNKAKSNGQLLTMKGKIILLLFLLYIMQHKVCVRDIPSSFHLPFQPPQTLMDLPDLWVEFISNKKFMHHVLDLDPAASFVLFYSPDFHQAYHICCSIPPAKCGINFL